MWRPGLTHSFAGVINQEVTAMRQAKSGPVGYGIALTLVLASFAIPGSAVAYYNGAGPANDPATAIQLPTAEQVAEHRGHPAQSSAATDTAADGGEQTAMLVTAIAVLLGVTGVAAVSVTRRARAHRTPQAGV